MHTREFEMKMSIEYPYTMNDDYGYKIFMNWTRRLTAAAVVVLTVAAAAKIVNVWQSNTDNAYKYKYNGNHTITLNRVTLLHSEEKEEKL